MKNIFVLLVIAVVFLSGCNSSNVKKQETYFAGPEYLDIGEWKLYDSREKINSLESLPNLKLVPVTGGVETAEGSFNGETKNISFVFDNEGLLYSQVWLYEGESLDKAALEFGKLYAFFDKHLGGASIKGLSADGKISPAVIENTAKLLFNNTKRGVDEVDSEGMTFSLTLDMKPAQQPKDNKFHGMFVYTGKFESFHVLLFEDRPGHPDRSAKTHIYLQEK